MIIKKLSAQDILRVLKINRPVPKLLINKISDFDCITDYTIYFVFNTQYKTISQLKNIFNKLKNSLFIIHNDIVINNPSSRCIFVDNPRLIFANLLRYIERHKLFSTTVKKRKISESALIHLSAVLDKYVVIEDNVIIEPFCYIGNDVIIKKNSIIKTGAKILGKTKIGRNTTIRENSVIGGFGFGIEKDEKGNNIRIPHLGGVSIGNNVEIGSLNTVCSGTIKQTTIEDYVKTDDHVHLAHNVHVKKNTIITAGVVFSGNVEVGDNSWIGINSSFIQGCKVGSDVLVGMGSVVLNNVSDHVTIAGNPSRNIMELRIIEKNIQSVLKKIK
jgi:UDP-3-O-[3-hydroxymyristoyl] glucosamine N-acyltransferase